MRFSLFLLLSLGGISQAFSNQNIYQKDQPKISVHAQKGIFTHPSLPLSFFMQGISSKFVPLSQTNKGIKEKLYLRKHGAHYLTLDDGGKTYKLPFFVDALPPHLSVTVSSNGIKSNNYKVFGPGLKLGIIATDRDSGVDALYYKINNKSFQVYTNPITSLKEGVNDISIFARDNVGNTSPIKREIITIDATPPNTKILLTNAIEIDSSWIASTKTLATVNSFDRIAGLSKTVYRLQQNDISLRSGEYNGKPIRMNGLKQGDYQLKVFAVDKVGNREKEQILNVFIDQEPPQLGISITGNKFKADKTTFLSPQSKIIVESKDNKSGVNKVEVQIANKPYKNYDSPLSPPAISGVIPLEIRASDKVGNATTLMFQHLTLDKVPPSVAVQFTGPYYKIGQINYVSPKTLFSLSAHDDLSGVKSTIYQIDSNEAHHYRNPLRFTKLGPLELSSYAVDQVENRSTPKKLKIFNDSQMPKIFARFSNSSIGKIDMNSKEYKIFPTNTMVFVSATDDHSGVSKISYRINKEDMIMLKDAWIPLKKEGTYNIFVESLDRVGNKASENFHILIRNPDLRAH